VDISDKINYNGGDNMDVATISLIGMFISAIISIASFVRSGSTRSTTEAREMGRFEQKLDGLIVDVKEIKKQNLENAKANSQTEERFKTLFNWKNDIDGRIKALERE